MFNINDLQKYACLKMEIFLKQPRKIVEEIKEDLSISNPGYDLGKDERYLIYYAMCFDILSRLANDTIVDTLTLAIKHREGFDILTLACKQREDYTLLFRKKEIKFPVQIVIDVCADILKGK